MFDFPFFPEQASTVAERVDMVYFVLLGLGTFFSALVVMAILYFCAKYRHTTTADRTDQVDASLRLEVGGALLLLVLSTGVFLWATQVYVSMAEAPDDGENPIELYVLGKQWMWEIQHPEGKRELNNLHVPVGRTIKLRMTSEDVIHCFYVPAFRIKRDVLPGRYSTTWFKATKKGTYHLFCSEYCGTEHSQMGGTVTVMDPAEYEEWLYEDDGDGPLVPSVSAPRSIAPARQNAMARAGERHFNRLQCNTCHGANAGILAPSLQGIYGAQHTMRDGETVTVDEDYLREAILYPSVQVREGYDAIMPPYQGQVSERELAQLIEYIKFLSDPAQYDDAQGPAPAGE